MPVHAGMQANRDAHKGPNPPPVRPSARLSSACWPLCPSRHRCSDRAIVMPARVHSLRRMPATRQPPSTNTGHPPCPFAISKAPSASRAQVVITGHSLGGMLAQTCAVDLLRSSAAVRGAAGVTLVAIASPPGFSRGFQVGSEYLWSTAGVPPYTPSHAARLSRSPLTLSRVCG